ncbi:hypothetical protein U8C41_00320 (plasmid) [Sinorhizobium meliloti]|uniref:hypothetical protein n=1 Tax=Rhizobium meliloti TaxID=382 RepID=UPI000D1E98E9|nr:hypothetical protein [Sinorhizobium meliloti]RMI05379.1 hypothetical protein DA101_022885 [Sinorhizobium meliloti]RVG86930.1 hypothetical protein CN218_29455 [Sinorhizobium meliloti]RVK90630.1 hypothetical protein CN150_27305 [Sinorhizobium meliloti]WQO97355.1 hypothetical protein U8C41_00320 [Sinorhizobium meliloti]
MTNPYEVAEALVRDFRAMEYALKRSGFRRQDREAAEPNWDLFAQSLGANFFDHVVAAGIAKTLIGDPPRRLLADMSWSPPNPAPLTNVAQLIVNGVCRVRNSYVHGEKISGGPEGQWQRDVTLILEAHAVLKEAMQFPGSPLKVAGKAGK